MQAYILLLVLATSLFSVDARNLAKPNGVFRVNLIHRNSPNSPYYDPSITPQERLRRAPFGSISHGHKIHLSPKYYDTQNNAELSSALIPNGGGYLIQITLGTPQVEVIAIADTGSDLIWTQCPQCKSCSPQKFPLFDPTQSSTFQTLSCSSSACSNSPYINTQCVSNNDNSSSLCAYEIGYGDGSKSIGVLATDTITIPSLDATSLSLPSSVFGCEIDQKGQQSNEPGIVGLGPNPTSLISQLGPNIDYKFSYCLAPLTSGVNSKLTFGADLMGSGLVSTPFTTGDYSNFYYITLQSITIGGNDSPVQVNVGQDVVIDSGTTLTYLPSIVYGGVKDALTKAIGLSPVASPVEGYDLCYESSSGQQLNPPDLVFHFNGADVVLKAINTFRDIGNGFTCLAMVASQKTFIFGNIAQVNYQVEYDLKAKQISFAPADCTTH